MFRLVFLLFTLTFFLSGCAQQSPLKPNIVLILADDLGWRDASFMGSKYYETPEIDALAKSGMIFTDAYSNAPNCAPTRACLLTGLYTPRHGIYTVATSARGKSEYRKLVPIKNTLLLDTSFVTVAEVLKSHGYRTASIGKWHLGNKSYGLPTAQGFEVNVGGFEKGHPKSYFSPYSNPFLTDGPEGEYLTDRLTNEALKFIDKNKDGPFFLYLPHYAVHTPIQAKDSLTAFFKNKPPDGRHNNPIYAAMIKSLDDGVGRIMAKIHELGLTENTIVIFTSDNGGMGVATGMEPLRGSKGMLYEGGIRVPFIASWPGKIKPETISHEPVISLDLYPTILSLAGITKPDGLLLDGIDFSPVLLKQRPMATRPLFWHFPAYLERYRNMNRIWRTTPASAIRYGDWKLIQYYEDNHIELYNLLEDIGETQNLTGENPHKRDELYAILDKWRKAVKAPVPTQLNPDFDQKKYDEYSEKLKNKFDHE